jgi:hypothetical protein
MELVSVCKSLSYITLLGGDQCSIVCKHDTVTGAANEKLIRAKESKRATVRGRSFDVEGVRQME